MLRTMLELGTKPTYGYGITPRKLSPKELARDKLIQARTLKAFMKGLAAMQPALRKSLTGEQP